MDQLGSKIARRKLAVAGFGGIVLEAARPAAAQTASGESTYDRVFRSKVIRFGVRPGDLPLLTKDLATQTWVGASLDLAKDIANRLGNLKLELVEEVAATNNILSLQTGRIDLTYGLSPTPERALSIDFSNSVFDHPFGLVAKPEFKATTWSDLDNSALTIAVTLGTAEESAARSFAPRANISGFRTRDEMLLALSSGRVQGAIFGALLGLIAVKRSPGAGEFRMLIKPRIALPSCMGVPKEVDGRWRELINTCLMYYRGVEQIKLWFEAAMEKQGIKKEDIPAGIFGA